MKKIKPVISYLIIPLNMIAIIGACATNKAYWMFVFFVCFVLGLIIGNVKLLCSVLKCMGECMIDTLKAVLEMFSSLFCFNIVGFLHGIFVYAKGILIVGLLSYVLIAFYMVPAIVYWGMKALQHFKFNSYFKAGA